MCESCKLKRIDLFTARGAKLPNVAPFITTGKKNYYVEHDCFTEAFFLIEVTKRRFREKRKKVIWPISYCPNCGQELDAINICEVYKQTSKQEE